MDTSLDSLVGRVSDLMEEKISHIMARLEGVDERLDSLDRRLSELEDQSVEKNMYQELNEELNRLQEDAEFKDRKPAINKLIALYDDLNHLEGDNFEKLKSRVLRALDLLDIHPITKKPEKFDPAFQEVVEVINTDKEEELKIAEVMSPGFKYKDKRIIRPQRVNIYKNNHQEGE